VYAEEGLLVKMVTVEPVQPAFDVEYTRQFVYYRVKVATVWDALSQVMGGSEAKRCFCSNRAFVGIIRTALQSSVILYAIFRITLTA